MQYPRPSIIRSFGIFIAVILLLAYTTTSSRHGVSTELQLKLLRVPQDLEERTLARFDQLVRKGRISYEETLPEIVWVDGFEFDFRVASILKKKPVLSPNDPSRSKAGGPFIDPDPDEIIVELGTSHRLLTNKYGVFRPMLVLPTIQYALQSDDLDDLDIQTAWAVLSAFKTPSLMIYNHGVNSGSSQGHKHTQVFPLPAHALWPSKAQSSTEVSTHLEGVPFKHFVLRLPEKADAGTAYKAYLRLLDLTRQALAESGSDSNDYNVAMTTEWIAVIPRRTRNGPYGANAAGMLGIIYVPDQQEREKWAEVGYTKHLKELGIPI